MAEFGLHSVIPSKYNSHYFRRPTGDRSADNKPSVARLKAGLTLDDLKTGTKISGNELCAKIEEARKLGSVAIIGTRLDNLGHDIIANLEASGSVKDLYRLCRSFVFCTDIYQEDGNRTASFADQFDRQPGIFVNSRFANGQFLQGLDFFLPMVTALSSLKAAEATPDKEVLPFLSALFTAQAINDLLGNFPNDLPAARTSRSDLEQLFTELHGNIQLTFSRLSLRQHIDLRSEIMQLYVTLTGRGIPCAATC